MKIRYTLNYFWNITEQQAKSMGEDFNSQWIKDYNDITNIIFGKVVLGLLLASIIVSIIYITLSFIKVQTNNSPENILNFKKRIIWTLVGLSIVIFTQTAIPYIVKQVYIQKNTIEDKIRTSENINNDKRYYKNKLLYQLE